MRYFSSAGRQIQRSIVRHPWMAALLVITLLSYACVLLPPGFFWPAVFISMGIPFLLILHAGLFFIFLAARKRAIIFPGIALMTGVFFIMATVQYNPLHDTRQPSFSILSFNAKLFRQWQTYSAFSPEMIQWVVRDTSGIKCIQEYSTDSVWEGLDVNRQLREQGYNGYNYKAKLIDSEHDPGLGIFTRYPVVQAEFIWEDPGSTNGAIFADVVIGRDTIRIYNVHLASMSLDLHAFRESHRYWKKIIHLARQLRNGAVKRQGQIDQLIDHTRKCPYPFLICGDFNETPYSYNYFHLRRNFGNSFESVGNGFGFSLNSRAFFLRIDNQFYSKGISPMTYTIDHSMAISDHFPTRGNYRIGH